MVPRPRNGLSICAGGGGLDMGLGLIEPDFHTRCYVEWEEYPRSVLIAAQRAGYFAPAPIWDDLTTFDARPIAGAIDTLLAGYPCQPFSAAGQRKGEDDPRHLFPHVARVARELGPSLNWIVLENVPGHVTLGLEAVLRTLWDMGFTPAVGLFSASETSAPHERLRMFIVAHRAVQLENPIGTGAGGNGSSVDKSGRDTVDGRGAGLRRSDGASGANGLAADGGQLDHTAGARCKPARIGADTDSESGECLPGDGRAELADAGCGRRAGSGEGQVEQPRRTETERSSRDLGNSARLGRGEGRPKPEFRRGRDTATRTGGKLANTSSTGREGCEQPGSSAEWDRAAAPGSATERRCVRLHPPGPSDRDAWAYIIGMAPELAPSVSVSDVKRACDHFAKMVEGGQLAQKEAERRVRRMADELAARTRGLRLLGNGVVPICAGYALRELFSVHGLQPVEFEGRN